MKYKVNRDTLYNTNGYFPLKKKTDAATTITKMADEELLSVLQKAGFR